jgi:hypothetical protein
LRIYEQSGERRRKLNNLNELHSLRLQQNVVSCKYKFNIRSSKAGCHIPTSTKNKIVVPLDIIAAITIPILLSSCPFQTPDYYYTRKGNL